MSNLQSPKRSPSVKKLDLKSSQVTVQGSPSKSGGGSLSPSRFYSTQDKPFFHNLSSSVLQHSSLSYRFPQADRFPTIDVSGPKSYCNTPTAMSRKATTLGYGGRVDLSTFGNKESAVFPSPQKYNIKSGFEEKGKGKTFGLSYASYEKVYVPGNKELPPAYAKLLPGPGAYYTDRDSTIEMPKLTMRPKGKMFNEGLSINSPKCSQYTPNHNLTERARYAKPTFGFGVKSDFTKTHNEVPGPGAYAPKSFVDKYPRRTQKAFI